MSDANSLRDIAVTADAYLHEDYGRELRRIAARLEALEEANSALRADCDKWQLQYLAIRRKKDEEKL